MVKMLLDHQGSETGQGSGFVYDKDWHLITNDYVAHGAHNKYYDSKITRWKFATIIGEGPYSDLAVLNLSQYDVTYDRSLEPLPSKRSNVQVDQQSG